MRVEADSIPACHVWIVRGGRLRCVDDERHSVFVDVCRDMETVILAVPMDSSP
jgi:hypothetical protein